MTPSIRWQAQRLTGSRLRRFVLAVVLATTAAVSIAAQSTDTRLPPQPPPSLPLITAQDLLDGFKQPSR